MTGNVVVVDDDRSLREMLEIILRKEGHNIKSFEDGALAYDWLKENYENIDVVISDILMPRLDGIGLLEKIKELDKDICVLMITAHTRVDYAIEALKKGAYDYITKPFNNDELKIIVRNAIERRNLTKENIKLRSALEDNKSSIIFKSKIMGELYLKALSVARTNSTVLITGESGTGKELFARLIHNESDRRNNPFFPVNCGAIPENLMESEFFGYERGAFTGASTSKAGYFELAHKGTIFLDEIGELPLALQVKLLRVLEDKLVMRIGAKDAIPVDVRVIAATNRDLESMVSKGEFRDDLFYRLNIVRLYIPPLRERKEDILSLAMHFLKKCCVVTNKNIKGFSKDALSFLESYSYPGNVRELQNIIERACVFETGELVGVGNLPIEVLQKKDTEVTDLKSKRDEIDFSEFDLDSYLGKIEKDLIERALKKSNGNKKEAADMLGITLWSLYHRLEKFGLK